MGEGERPHPIGSEDRSPLDPVRVEEMAAKMIDTQRPGLSLEERRVAINRLVEVLPTLIKLEQNNFSKEMTVRGLDNLSDQL